MNDEFTDELYDFALFVTREIFDNDWENNKKAFAEIACRKLVKLGIIKQDKEYYIWEDKEKSVG